MLLAQGEDFLNLFHESTREAFHLEVQDTYETPEESEPFRKFIQNEADDYMWFQPWLNHVRETTSRGVAVKRARVVTTPHTDYTRFAKDVARFNIEAGEDVRYLTRHRIDPDELTADDWWLFDDAVLAFTAFEPDGTWVGAAVTTDRRLVEYARKVKKQVWSLAVPLLEYSDQ
ncbi:DUF6879 family protein [Nocardia goodfellowii]|uniref:DUF6879 domain-containing protein n=1 Tax=Nocardia goodfellowii TaxID=882446 RepID=A0ABS4QR80_9NOCA|nr:DUF6879 family protein [Nocardia goodfellowii]MBP2194177.1 hypothetical protein [Nocardia goodfellowii]